MCFISSSNRRRARFLISKKSYELVNKNHRDAKFQRNIAMGDPSTDGHDYLIDNE